MMMSGAFSRMVTIDNMTWIVVGSFTAPERPKRSDDGAAELIITDARPIGSEYNIDYTLDAQFFDRLSDIVWEALVNG